MKKTIVVLALIFSFVGIKAQEIQYLEEAYSLIKIKSFNIKNNTKKCGISCYMRVGENFQQVEYYVELISSKTDGEVIFRDLIKFTDLTKFYVAKSFRNKGNVYEFNFGDFNIGPDAYLQLVMLKPNGEEKVMKLKNTNYKNPITIMN